MNKYGLPLQAPSIQTIIPAMTDDGRVFGFYPIAQRTFNGSETTLTTSDGAILPMKSVTVDPNPTLRAVAQYMAAVWPKGIAVKSQPWASADLIGNEDGAYSWWSLPTQGWVHHFGKGTIITAITSNLRTGYSPDAVVPPSAINGAQTWATSLSYQALSGDCAYFDFNWMTVFKAKNNNGNDPVRIQLLTNPGAILKATVIGTPVVTANGVIYDTVRIMRLGNVAPGNYEFTFRVIDTKDQRTDVTLTLTVL